MVWLFGVGFPGHFELLILLALFLVLFGNRLPSVMRSLGRSIVEFKKGVQGIEDDIDQAGRSETTGKIDGKVERDPMQE